ncbi:MAG: LPS export ABC transporter periplasmic protein LptC [Chromatiales bacterium]|nr:LPS export ABC transporter periplasmic protein LptC [Chromatiales bacterium]
MPGLPLILLVLAVAVSAWLAGTLRDDDRRATSDSNRPDYIATSLDAITMDPQGRPKYRLQASTLAHYPSDNSTRLFRPRLRIHDEPRPAWDLHAERAWVSADGNEVLLDENVRLRRPGATGSEPMRVDTSQLRVQPRNHYAETDRHVTLASGSSTLEGMGMKSWFGEDGVRLQLQAEVKGKHVIQ